MFDLKQRANEAQREDEGTRVHIKGLDGRPMYHEAGGERRPVTITVAGTLSRRYRRVENGIRRRRIDPKALTGEQFYDDAVDKAVACTLAWDGFAMDGQPIEPSEQNVRQVYLAAPEVLDQVTEAMQDHTRFFGSASPGQ